MPFCQFCKQNVEDPCFKPAEAAMRCEINASVALNSVPAPTATSLAERANYDPLPPDLQMQPVGVVGPTNNMFHQAPDWNQLPPMPYQPPVQQPGKFHFDDNVLELLKEARNDLMGPNDSGKAQQPSIEKIWERAKELADEFEVVMKPTLKRKPKEE